MSISPRVENPVFRKFLPDTSKVEDTCPPPHPRWQESQADLHKSPWNEALPKVDAICKPTLQRTNSVMNPDFFQQPIKVDGKPIKLDRGSSCSTPIDESIITVAGDIIPPESESRSEPVIEVDCSEVDRISRRMHKKRFKWCSCLKGNND